MAKKNRRSDHKKPKPGGGSTNMSRDLTAERHFSSQIGKAERFIENEDFENAVEILAPLIQKYPDRMEVFEMLGTAYFGLELPMGARDAFERAIQVSPANQVDPLLRFNLASSYLMTNLPLLAFDQIEQIDWQALGREMEGIGGNELLQFRELTTKAVSEMAAQNNLAVAEFVKQAMPLERGQLALQRNEPDEARAFFQQAIELNPNSTAAHNSLALMSMLEEDYATATQEARYILDKLEPDNLDALTTLVRVSLAQGDEAATQGYLAQLKALPVPAELENRVLLAETYALFQQDQAIYDLLKPMLDQETDETDEEETSLQQATFLTAVAAAHLGRPEEAATLLDEAPCEDDDLLFDRTAQALENGEEGPRPGGRFFYTPSNLEHPVAFYSYENTLRNAGELLDEAEDKDITLLQPFLQEYGPVALDIMLYQLWITDQPLLMNALLSETFESGIEGATALVERLAFGKSGTLVLHLVAAGILIEKGVYPANQPLTLWDGREAVTGTFEELSEKFGQEE